MAELVTGIGASHTTLMNTQWDKVDHLPGAHAFRDALKTASDRLKALRPDFAVIIGPNHFRGHWLDLMPSFAIGVGEVEASGEHGTPCGPQQGAPDHALAIAESLVTQGFDMAFSTRLAIDHGISHAIQYLTGEQGIPIVPLLVNSFAPPLPGLARCIDLGRALRNAIDAIPASLRVAVIASGGLSHRLPFPDWRAPKSDEDAFLVDSWKNGRGDWQRYEERRRAIVVNAPADLNPDFDRAFLAALETGETLAWTSAMTDTSLVEQAGNGANEIRNWLIMHAALGFRPGETLAYEPIEQWLTGMGVFMTKHRPATEIS